VLAQVPLFSGLPPRFLKRLADRMEEHRYMEGARVVRHGDTGDSFYVILEGEARVEDPSGRAVNRLLPGEFFGEISLLDGGPRTATVVAETPLKTLVLARRDFRELIGSEPEVAVRLLRHASSMLRRLERSASG
jgi:CRP-like cAMP-binding protein